MGHGQCTNCHEEGEVNRCSVCSVAKYCSKECQQEDWESHKNLCRLEGKKAQTDDPEEDERQNSLKGLLNKITPDNFDKMIKAIREFENVLALMKAEEDRAKKGEAYKADGDDEEEEETETMELTEKEKELTKREKAVTKREKEVTKREKELTNKEKDLIEEDSELAEAAQDMKARHRLLSSVNFIGHLYKHRLLNEKIIHSCLATLLSTPSAIGIECFCKLVSNWIFPAKAEGPKDVHRENAQ
eukprot:gene5615-4101_t